jgi:RimJ/RimL family protein N-acetyltransferase
VVDLPQLRTSRLVLRLWRDEDLPAFAKLNADPLVTQFLGGPLNREQSDALAERIGAGFVLGFGLWAVEIAAGAEFAGFVGLSRPNFNAPFTPCVEVGWRLSRAHWGQGYATEAARAAMSDGFERIGLREIVSFTALDNLRSRRVMERLGMRHTPRENFEHPLLPPGHPLRMHALYRLRADEADI